MKFSFLAVALLTIISGCHQQKAEKTEQTTPAAPAPVVPHLKPGEVSKPFTAVGQIVLTEQDSRSGQLIRYVAVKTPSEYYFLIPFRMDQEIIYDNHMVGELKYHTCGGGLYCFDSFRSLYVAPKPKY